MAEGTKTSALTALASVASTDLIPVVDVSDTTMAASGTNKKATVADLATAITAAGSLATDAEVTSAISTHAGQADPHTVYALESSLATIATTGSASNLTTGTVPTARLGSGSANSNTYLRGDQAWTSFPSTLDAGLGGALPYKWSDPVGPELWAVANFVNFGAGANTTVLNPTLTANSTNQTSTTAISLGNLANWDTPFRFKCNITSMPSDGWASVRIGLTDSGGTLLSGTDWQRITNTSSNGAIGYFEVDFLPQASGGSQFRLIIETVSNSTTGAIVIADISLREIAFVQRPMMYGETASGSPGNQHVFTPLFDPVSNRWQMMQLEFGVENVMTRSPQTIQGFVSDLAFSAPPPDPSFTRAAQNISGGASGPALTASSVYLYRQLRSNNNDQIQEVLNGSAAYELRCNTHGGETNTTPIVYEVDRGDGTWVTWDGLGKHLHWCRRFRATFPTSLQISTDADPYASVDHVLTVFPDGVQRMDRTTTFLKDVRMRSLFEWMSSHDLGTPKLGRIGRGMFVLDECDIYNKLAAPASPGVSTNTSGGSLAAATYGYRVTSLSEMGESTPTAGFTQVTTGTTSVNTITWSAVTNATGYRVYGRSSTLALQTLLATIPAGTTTWDDDGTAVPSPGQFVPTVNTARRDTGALTNAQDVAMHQTANWAAWYDVPLNMVFANIYDRDSVLARDNVAAIKTRLEQASGVCKNYLNVYWDGDGNVDTRLNTQPVTTGTVWPVTHWCMVYCPADRTNWHNEVATRSLDLNKLKELYPAT